MAQLNNIAVAIMRHLCEHDWHGYDQNARWGDGEGYCDVVVDGVTYSVAQGDRDCSSAVIDAWRNALMCTRFEGLLDAATYTGNMRRVFVASGLFEWHDMSFTAQPGDIYLNEANHTAMCVSADPDLLAEFSINENGGITGGAVGDQTGRESRIGGFYNYPFDGILHYIGGDISTGSVAAANTNAIVSGIDLPLYRVKTLEDGWLDWMSGMTDTGGSSDDFAGEIGHAIVDAEITGLGNSGWYYLTLEDGTELERGAQNTTTQKVTGITIYYDTDTAKTGGVYYKAKYRVAPIGADYLKWEYDNETDGAGGAGAIDRLQLTLEQE